MPRKKKEEVLPVEEVVVEAPKVEEVPAPVESEKEHLLALYQELKDRKINSIGDLENLIARS